MNLPRFNNARRLRYALAQRAYSQHDNTLRDFHLRRLRRFLRAEDFARCCFVLGSAMPKFPTAPRS